MLCLEVSLIFLCGEGFFNKLLGFDLAATFPKYINIRRGAYITAFVSIACNPWKLVNTPTVFLSVMGGYMVFLGPMIGLMIASFIVIHRFRLKVDDLYVGNPSSIYWFSYGFNWRAPVGYGHLPIVTRIYCQCEPES